MKHFLIVSLKNRKLSELLFIFVFIILIQAAQRTIKESEAYFGRKLADNVVSLEKEVPTLTNTEIAVLEGVRKAKVRRIEKDIAIRTRLTTVIQDCLARKPTVLCKSNANEIRRITVFVLAKCRANFRRSFAQCRVKLRAKVRP